MSKSATHPKHTKNRLAMARRIVEFIDTNPIFDGANTPEVVAEFDDRTWALVSAVMGEKRVPSEGTIAMVIGILIGREMVR